MRARSTDDFDGSYAIGLTITALVSCKNFIIVVARREGKMGELHTAHPSIHYYSKFRFSNLFILVSKVNSIVTLSH